MLAQLPAARAVASSASGAAPLLLARLARYCSKAGGRHLALLHQPAVLYKALSVPEKLSVPSAPVSGMHSQRNSQRSLIHVPAMTWGAAKIGALLGGVAAKHHAIPLAAKWFANVGSSKVLKALRELNDALLKSGVQDAEAHASLQQSITSLERRLASVAANEQVRLFRQWVETVEKQAPELIVALGHAYLDNFKSVKLAKAALKGFDAGPVATKPRTESIEGISVEEWERRIHTKFPELQNYKMIFIPKEQHSQRAAWNVE